MARLTFFALHEMNFMECFKFWNVLRRCWILTMLDQTFPGQDELAFLFSRGSEFFLAQSFLQYLANFQSFRNLNGHHVQRS